MTLDRNPAALLAESESLLAHNPAAALELARQAGEALSGDDSDEAARLRARIGCQTGAAYIWLGRYGDAIALLREVATVASQRGLDVERARAHNNLGVACMKLGDAATALDYFDQALVLRRALNDRAGLAATLHNIGIQRRELGDWAGARQAYEETLQFDRESGDRLGEGRTLMSIGVLAFGQGRMDEAEPLFRQATAIALECNDLISAARGFENIASIAIESGRIEEALAEVDKGSAAALTIGSPDVQANLHATRGKALRVAARLAEALQAFELAAGLIQAENNKRFAIELLGEISQTREQLGDAAGALAAIKRAFALEREVNTEDARRRLEAIAFRHEVERAHSRAARFERLAHEDTLTGLGNRRWLEVKLLEAAQPAATALRPLSVVMLDVDHFKQINDRLSHAVGDLALQAVARIVRDQCREGDVAARYGGEEFALVLTRTALASAVELGERIRAAVEQFDWSTVHPELRVTLSGGAASANDAGEVADLLSRADLALYRAKANGRNRVSQ